MRPADVVIRPMVEEDVPAADAVGWAALRAFIPVAFREQAEAQGRAELSQVRFCHLLEHDSGGCHVAEIDGEVAGVALALKREGLWGLSLFAVAPDHQGKGIGTRLIEPVLAYSESCSGAIILSSQDARAQRRYARAGFALRPAFSATGQINASRIPDGLRSRPGDLEADRATIDASSRHVRGASHAVDLPALIAAGGVLLVCEDRGYVVVRHGSPVLLAALDDDAAVDLLWSSLAAGKPGESVHVDFLTAEQQWAVGPVLDAGLALGSDGPVFTRGDVRGFAPYIPHGAYL